MIRALTTLNGSDAARRDGDATRLGCRGRKETVLAGGEVSLSLHPPAAHAARCTVLIRPFVKVIPRDVATHSGGVRTNTTTRTPAPFPSQGPHDIAGVRKFSSARANTARGNTFGGTNRGRVVRPHWNGDDNVA